MSTYSPSQLIQSFSHVGVCVTDIERSRRFYCEGLGFTEGNMFTTDNRYHELLGIPEKLLMHNQFLRLGQTMIELIQFDEPTLVPGPALRPIHQIGFTHLSFRVADIDKVVSVLEALGGGVLPATRTLIELPGKAPGDMIMCLDPDGNRVELMCYPEDVVFA